MRRSARRVLSECTNTLLRVARVDARAPRVVNVVVDGGAWLMGSRAMMG